MNRNTVDQDLLIVSCFVLLVISGGVLARVKKDFISRGMAITFITGIFGIIAMIFSPTSKARVHDEHDIHGWPANAHFAVFTQFLFAVIFLMVH
jgi:hypothetical protein